MPRRRFQGERLRPGPGKIEGAFCLRAVEGAWAHLNPGRGAREPVAFPCLRRRIFPGM